MTGGAAAQAPPEVERPGLLVAPVISHAALGNTRNSYSTTIRIVYGSPT